MTSAGDLDHLLHIEPSEIACGALDLLIGILRLKVTLDLVDESIQEHQIPKRLKSGMTLDQLELRELLHVILEKVFRVHGLLLAIALRGAGAEEDAGHVLDANVEDDMDHLREHAHALRIDVAPRETIPADRLQVAAVDQESSFHVNPSELVEEIRKTIYYIAEMSINFLLVLFVHIHEPKYER